MASNFRRSNVLLEHVLGAQEPRPLETWRLRKGDRRVVVDAVHPDGVDVHDATTGRRAALRRDTFAARYVKVDHV